MSRWWNELVADLGDLVPGGVPVLALGLFLLTALASALWYWWPAWLPTRRPWGSGTRGQGSASTGRERLRWRLGRLRLRWRLRWWRRRNRGKPVVTELPEDQVPELPAAVFASHADELAAAGRFKEAVRERLRAIVRELIERQVIAAVPGWTVTELARVAGRVRPETAGPLDAASTVFSEIWYGLRPATADDDRAMRHYADQVRAALAGAVSTAGGRP